jgi:alpha-amylase
VQLAENVLTFNMLYEGIPVLYYGQEQNLNGSFNPVNREALWLTGYDISAPLYRLTSTLNALRTHAITSNDTYLNYIGTAILHDAHTLALRKGFDGNQIIILLNNNGADSRTYEITLSGTGFSERENITEVIGCKTMTAGREGDLAVGIEKGAPQVFYPTASLEGTSICKAGDHAGYGNSGGGSGKPNASLAARRFPEPLEPLWNCLWMSVFICFWIFVSQLG